MLRDAPALPPAGCSSGWAVWVGWMVHPLGAWKAKLEHLYEHLQYTPHEEAAELPFWMCSSAAV